MVMMVIEFFDLDPDKGRGGEKKNSRLYFTLRGFFFSLCLFFNGKGSFPRHLCFPLERCACVCVCAHIRGRFDHLLRILLSCLELSSTLL